MHRQTLFHLRKKLLKKYKYRKNVHNYKKNSFAEMEYFMMFKKHKINEKNKLIVKENDPKTRDK